ncbi:OsmC family protein, partial [Crocinitomicaceae bacterium]|nr:OsmC family protein [Crocinitomicaceae bacterium]
MATSKVEYLGGLRTKATHLKSGSEIVTDAPVDNNGKGEAFSPTDLMATAYASCLLTIIGIFCANHDL